MELLTSAQFWIGTVVGWFASIILVLYPDKLLQWFIKMFNHKNHTTIQAFNYLLKLYTKLKDLGYCNFNNYLIETASKEKYNLQAGTKSNSSLIIKIKQCDGSHYIDIVLDPTSYKLDLCSNIDKPMDIYTIIKRIEIAVDHNKSDEDDLLLLLSTQSI